LKPRRLKLVAKVAGFPTDIAEVHIQNFASEAELKDWTEMVCPECLGETKYQGAGYSCSSCNQTYSWWGKLKRVAKGTKNIIEMPKLLKEGEISKGLLYKMKREDFAKYCDATKSEKGVNVTDTGSARNLKKLLVAVEKCGYVIITTYNDTTEQVIALLKVSLSGRIILQEIIPLNLVKIKESLKMDETISEEEIEEAKMFVDKFLPDATEKNLKVTDYRASWIEGHIVADVKEEPERIRSLKEIMAMVK
jgi:hypothetical protein